MERQNCKSEFSSAYKLTTCTVDKKGLRVRRRSMEQKQMRRELTNKNRNMVNLSPLQEEDVSIHKSYKEKTPIKRNEKKGQDGQKIDNRKMQMLKWKEERMKAKKLEVAKKKPVFKISGKLDRDDLTLYSESKNSKTVPKPSEKTKAFMIPQTNKALPTRASTRLANKPIASTSRGKEKKNGSANNTCQSAADKVKENERPTPVKNNVKNAPKVCEDKVTTTRGGGEISFAPEDFTFTAPSSITSYIFQPLSPASAAQFLYPTQDTSSSFYDSAPGRCSTPKSSFISDSNKLDKPVNEEDINKRNADASILKTGETVKVESIERKVVERQPKPQGSLRKSKVETCIQLEKLSSSGRVTRSMRLSAVEKTSSDNDLSKQNQFKSELDKQNRSVSYWSKTSVCMKAEESSKINPAEVCATVSYRTPKKITDSEEDSSLETVEEGQITKQEYKSTPLKTEKMQSQKRVTRRSVAVMEAEFACPTETSIMQSAKKSSQKRRKTHLEKISKSPEEWIELLRQSPMIEMTRRTPRRKSNTDLNVTVPLLNFDDIDLDGSLTVVVPEPDSNAGQNLQPVETDFVPAQRMQPESTVTSTEMYAQDSVVVDSLDILTGHSDLIMPDSISKKNYLSSEQVQDPDISSSTTKPGLADGEHDVKYFRSLLVHHTERLTQLCDQWAATMDSTHGLHEDVKGQIRTVVGQAQLLMCQRFKQFTGLVDNCEFGLGEKETTCMDLQGFWDMIYFQVEDVDMKFEELSNLQKNNWVPESDKPVKKVPMRKPSQVSNPKPKANVKSKFAAFRAQMKKQTQSDGLPSPMATIPSSDAGINVFDAGFFKVISPVRSPKPHCEAGTPKSKSSEQDSVLPVSQGYLTPTLQRQTPLRRSYLPVVPSPLLQDTTPRRQIKCRSSLHKSPKQNYVDPCAEIQSESSNNDKKHESVSDSNSFSVSVKYDRTLSLEGNNHKESEMLRSTTPSVALPTKRRRSTRKSKTLTFTESIADKENLSTPMASVEDSERRQSVSSSRRTRRSVCFTDDPSKREQEKNSLACELGSRSDPFLKYLQPIKAEQKVDDDSFSKYLNITDTSLPFSSPEVKNSPLKRKVSPSQETSSAKKSRLSNANKSILKRTPSSTKLGTRRSVRFRASADEGVESLLKLPTTPYLPHRSGVTKDADICNVLDEATPRRNTRRSVSQQKQQMENGLSDTALIMKSRLSLLYDPEEVIASTSTQNFGSDLIVFTP